MVLTALTGLLLDQVSKAVAVVSLTPGRPVPVLGEFFQLDLIRNSGAAFSLGSGVTAVFSCLALVASVGLAWWAWPRVRTSGHGFLVGMALAGIVGNLVDRLVRPPGVLRGHVVDFFHLQHFAIFNVADIFITCTAVWLVAASMFSRPERSQQEKA